MTIEEHPLKPFLPANARVLFLGSFPPPKARWCMEFFYPNWINDFWRIQGLIHFEDSHYFEATPETDSEPAPDGAAAPYRFDGVDAPSLKAAAPHRFDKSRIVSFCESAGLAFFDTARKVCRLKDNADDNFLEIVERTDVFELLEQLPDCHTIVTTGGKASEELQAYLATKGLELPVPKVGEFVTIDIPSELAFARETGLKWYRMPSTSRAYPMKLERKAEFYKKVAHY